MMEEGSQDRLTPSQPQDQAPPPASSSSSSSSSSSPPQPGATNDNHPPSKRNAAFSFPALSPDGSLQDLRSTLQSVPKHQTQQPKFTTPPAALSSLGAKTAMASAPRLEESVNSLADTQYDMLDDVSEMSNDDRETASLTSTPYDNSDDDGEDDAVVVEEEPAQTSLSTIKDARKNGAESQLWESYMSEDLDTPRQSMLKPTILAPMNGPLYYSLPSVMYPQPTTDLQPKAKKDSAEGGPKQSSLDAARNGITAALAKQKFVLTALSLVGFLWASLSMAGLGSELWPGNLMRLTAKETVSHRRAALTSALYDLADSTQAVQAVDINVLVPDQGSSLTEQRAQGQQLMPNHIITSFYREEGKWSYPYLLQSTLTSSNGTLLPHKTQKLIDGIYALSILNEQPRGQVALNILTRNPDLNISGSCDFGGVSAVSIVKSAAKDLILARDATIAWMTPLAAPLNAGLKATRNVTTELAIYMRRDLALFNANTTSLSTFLSHTLSETLAETNKTVQALTKDLVLATQDLVLWQANLSRAAAHSLLRTRDLLLPSGPPASAVVAAPKRFLADSIRKSRSRAHLLRERLLGGKEIAANRMVATQAKMRVLAERLARRRAEGKVRRAEAKKERKVRREEEKARRAEAKAAKEVKKNEKKKKSAAAPPVAKVTQKKQKPVGKSDKVKPVVHVH